MKITNLKITGPDSYDCEVTEKLSGKDFTYRMGFSLNMLLIRTAWQRGCNLEAEADGFGPGAGTHGDWSAIRDSSDQAKVAMLEKALNFLFPED